MSTIPRRIGWIIIGTIGLWWILVGAISNGVFIVSGLGIEVSSVLLLLSLSAIAGVTWRLADEDESLWDAFTDSARRIATKLGLVRPRVVVEGAILYDDVVWICKQFRNGASEVSHRACPSCGLELVESHATTSEVDDGTSTDGGRTVDALSCPHCVYNTPGQKHELAGGDAALSRFEKEIQEMRGAGGFGFEQWRRMAKEAIGLEPTPAAIWDEYAKLVDDEALKRRTGGSLEDGEHRAVDTYPAFAELKQKRNRRERALEIFPEPLDLVLANLLRTDYLEEKETLKRKRDAARQEYEPVKDRFYDEYEPILDSLTTARSSRSWPEESLTEEDLVAIGDDIDSLKEIREEYSRFLTGAESETIAKLSKQYSEAHRYLKTATELRPALANADQAVDAFESEFAPYANHDTYLRSSVEDRLEILLFEAQNAVEAAHETVTAASEPVPTEARERLSHLKAVVSDRGTELDEYESEFIKNEVKAHPDVFQTEHGTLNEKQTLAVVRNEPHNLVDASAGTGKTLTLTRRLLYLYEKGTPLEDMVAITFTSDAAEEMRTRVAEAIGGIDPRRLNIMTIHSLARDICSRAMRGTVDRSNLKNGSDKFLDRAFEDDPEFRNLAPEAMDSFQKHRRILPETDPETFSSESKEERQESADDRIRTVFEKERSFGKSPGEIRDQTDRGNALEYRAVHAVAALLEVYDAFAESRDHPIDHDHSIDRAIELVNQYTDRYQDKYAHVLVDEFQDVSKRQLNFIEGLLGPDTHLFAVGDDWQSIYGFRGSKPAYFRQFESRFEDTSQTTLEKNYRCAPDIVQASAAVMANSDEATSKEVRAYSDLDTTPVLHRIKGAYSGRLGTYIADQIEEVVGEDDGYGDVMVLTRNNDKGEDHIVPRLRSHGIPANESTDTDEDEETSDSVTVQTVHSSKGTEAKHVFIAHAVDDQYDGMPIEPKEIEGVEPVIDSSIDHYEQERRLFYVALTRAEKTAHVVAAAEMVSRYADSISSHFEIVEDELNCVEGELRRVKPSDGKKPHKLIVDCDEYAVHLKAWEAALIKDLEVGERYCFDDLTYKPSSYKDDLRIDRETNIRRLEEPEAATT